MGTNFSEENNESLFGIDIEAVCYSKKFVPDNLKTAM
jgi:hypothetical protein